MPGPFTVNAGFVVPVTGTEVGTWGSAALNPDFVALDGLLCGVQAVSVSNVPVTLTSPAAFTPTPGGGPTQSQNRVLRFTGVLTANVTVTLPIPGSYIIENLTTGAFVLSFRGITATEVIGTPQGERIEIYNDGANVRFVGLGRMGSRDHWVGLSLMPAWVAACTVKPYLLCDGTVYNFSDYPYLGARLLGNFGGNGITTFGVPDTRGRLSLPYDGTGARITTAGCGIDGQTLGAAGGTEAVVLATANVPSITSVNAAQAISVNPGGDPTKHVPELTGGTAFTTSSAGPGPGIYVGQNGAVALNNQNTFSGSNSISVTSQGTTGDAHRNVQPSIVTGIDVIKT